MLHSVTAEADLQLRLPGRPPLAMQRRSEIDPYVNELFGRHADVKKPWVDAVPSSHLWVADLPDDLGPGTYTVSVQARDEFGRVHHAHRILEVEGSSAGDRARPTEPR